MVVIVFWDFPFATNEIGIITNKNYLRVVSQVAEWLMIRKLGNLKLYNNYIIIAQNYKSTTLSI